MGFHLPEMLTVCRMAGHSGFSKDSHNHKLHMCHKSRNYCNVQLQYNQFSQLQQYLCCNYKFLNM